jgi:hypothetical protein
MKAVGVILLVFGLLGLVLNLILWLPYQFSPSVVVLIAAACLVAVWGGGVLYQSKTIPVIQPAGKFESVPPTPSTQWLKPPAEIVCPKCGCQIMPGQQYCGGCGSRLVSYCARCGAAIKELSRFCGSCGARLS